MSRARAPLALAAAALVAAAASGALASAPSDEIDAVPALPSPAERLEEIRARVQAAVVYPPRARELGIEGVARIQFRIAPDGRAAEITTVEGSGSRLLDAAAEQGARDAGRLPPLYGWVRIPVRFSLERAR